MKTKNVIIVLIALAFVGGFLWFSKKPAEAPSPSVSSIEQVFENEESGESVTVSFNSDDTATVHGAGYENVLLVRVISGSGARYANEEIDLELWNKGDAITLSHKGEAIFIGSVPSDPSEPDPLTIELLTANPWVWQKTVMNSGEIVTPNKAEAFTLTFTARNIISGTTDCNNFSGTYSLKEDGALSFGPIASTKMFCEDSQEMEFNRMVTDSNHAFISLTGELVLALPYDSGSVIFVKQ